MISTSSASSRGATINDVAAHAGVAPMTVSRALNGGYVSEEKRELVLKAVEELGYRPNITARSMKSGKSRQVGVLVRNNSRLGMEEIASHPLAYELTLGISEGLEEAGYMMSLVRLSDVDPQKHTQSSSFQGHLLDGLIVVSDVPAASVERLEELVPRCVWLDSNVWRAEGCVRRDERHAGETAARAIADLGYRKWVVLHHQQPTEARSHYSFSERMAGIEAVAAQVGASVRPFVLDWEQKHFEALWPQIRPDVAVIGLEIYATLRLLYSAMENGRWIGRDFALASCDAPFRGGGMNWPQLARVSFDRFELGYQAAQLMIRRLDQTEQLAPSRILRGQWKPGSTAPLCPTL